MRYLLSWFCEYRDGKTERKAKVFTSFIDAKKYTQENLDDDESVMDYDVYVPLAELNYTNREIDELKRKISAAINKLNG